MSLPVANRKHKPSVPAILWFKSQLQKNNDRPTTAAPLVKEPPSGDQWLHELKFDGYRMVCRIDRGKGRFWSRNGKDWTDKFLNVVDAVKSLPVKSAILDARLS